MKEVLELLNENRVVYFATVTESGQPRVRPFLIAHISEGKFYFFTATFKEVYKQLLANPYIEFNVIPKENISIRVQGNIMLEEDLEIKNKILDLNEGIKSMYKGREEGLKLFFMEHCEVQMLDLTTGTPKIVNYTT